MNDHRSVYQQDGNQYQQLISREDFQWNLLPAINKISELKNLDVYDLGAGTGRLTRLLAPLVRSIHAFDLSPHMLEVAAAELKGEGVKNWQVTAADHRWIPRDANSADLIVSGWSICYLVVWESENWRESLDAALAEMKRLLRVGGKIIIIETLGTGTEKPEALDKMKNYFKYLKRAGFQRSWIRTDYQFNTYQEAVELTRFFFGEEMLDKIGPDKKPRLPECTGIWWITAT